MNYLYLASCISGDLLYYGRAEVKSSDHRPVVAYIDIDVQHVESESRSQTVSDLMKQMGPPNAAILVKLVDLRQQNWVCEQTIFDPEVFVLYFWSH